MMLHPLIMLVALTAILVGAVAALVGEAWTLSALGAALIAGLAAERLWVGARAARRFGDGAAWLFPVFHLLRDVAWVAAIVVWTTRRLGERPVRPSDSMHPRPLLESERWRRASALQSSDARVIALIPAHNEAANLESVILDVARRRPDLDQLVIDDGSTDGTGAVLERLGANSMQFPERMGIGSAMRAGLRYAFRLGFDVAVRLDGDGQHDARDIDALLAPIWAGRADVVLGSRYARAGGGGHSGFANRLFRPPLATCLSALTGRRVTDPTSGFCAFGPAAVRLLGEHHPDGYAEPELRLFLSRNGLTVVEVPVRSRSRLSGRTSLTASRVAAAAARVLLAMLIVPLRAAVKQPPA